ncbi:MAG: ABC transporter substrate-binding protein [Rhodospirillales bacterium]
MRIDRRIARAALGAAALAIVAVASAEGAEPRTPALEKLLKDAQAEKAINIVWGPTLGAAEGARGLQDGINKAYGINITVNFTPGPSMPQMASRVIQEVKAGRAASTDVLLGAEAALAQAIVDDALLAVPWRDYFPHIKPEMLTKRGHAVHIVTLFTGIYYNTQFIKPEEAPNSMAEVFNPKWKGRIASTPYAAGFDRLAVSHGAEKIRPIVKKTAEWAGGLIRCGEYERLASGEFIMLFLDCGRTDDGLLREKGGPLEQKVLDDAALTTNWYFGVPKNSTHPNLAVLLTGFVASPAGQAVIHRYGGTTSHYVEGTRSYKEAKELEGRGVKLLTMDPDDLLPHIEQLGKYRNEFQATLRSK